MPRNAKDVNGNPIPEPAEGRIFKGWTPNQHSQGTVENVFKPYKGEKKTNKRQKASGSRAENYHTPLYKKTPVTHEGIFAYY